MPIEAIRPASAADNPFSEIKISGYTVLIDATDLPFLDGRTWHVSSVNGGKKYVMGALPNRGHGWRRVGAPEYLHHILTGWSYVDHRNGNGLDNRRANLRPATQQQNTYNRGPVPSRTSGPYKGVYLRRHLGTYYAQIQAEGVCYNGPSSPSAEVCARWYDMMARKLHGEFAYQNFPEDETSK